MALENLGIDIGNLSLAVFGLCFIISAITSSKFFKKGDTARAVRAKYRKSWTINILKKDESGALIDFFRNNITVSSALLGGLVVGFGLVANSMAGDSGFNVHLEFIIAILAYAIFYILIEIRTLIYLPVIFGTDAKLIQKHENMGKEDYLGRLLDNAYDDLSNAIRALFYLIALLVFPIDKLLFIAVTLILTYLFVRRDISEKSRIEIF